jgi:glycosyltransferase involved in cell wall biosynthesis
MNTGPEHPLVSVVTVVLNGRQYVESAIQSVLAQTYPGIEYLVIDGGSSDGSLEIIRKYRERIHRIVSEPDSGIYDAMNKGIRLSSGSLIGILNSDDWYEADAVAAAVAAWRRNPDAGIIHGRMAMHAADGTQVREAGHRNRPLLRLLATPFKHPATFVTRETYDRVGVYDRSLRSAADYDFMLRAIRHGVRAVHVPAVLARVRMVGMTTADPGVPAPDELTDVLTRHVGYRWLARILVLARKWWRVRPRW